MGCHVDFYLLKRDILKAKFIELEKEEDKYAFFRNYLIEKNIKEGDTYSATDASIIIQKVKEDTLLLNRDELNDIKNYIYEVSVGWGYNPENERFVKKMHEFGFELIHDISHGCASLFLLSLGDSESVDYSSWNYDERDRMNIERDEFTRELEYIMLLHSKIQLNECDNLDEKNELIVTIENLEKNELLNNVVESHFDSAMEDERLVSNSESILFNAVELSRKIENIRDGIVIFYS
ncbi:hypothetical protein DBB36_09500 [Flavobacterium sp. WLB]|uniref:hypothetical protein n=1 Tax=unclassified Flavobacterium TaxID=196869 RepID=UPI0006AB9675|nr:MULTISPECIES: hypothetical protein [unclassified Flavobacterium]KOP40062.1 hypothetical protein AKO67_00015 [Flavobacterium sp. VMW]OWU90757.1 hypothetical protein APR43_09750 [Flavobacterium sp. NLM]PUU70239.1 hypothetical protein DBB36_09500 [Flavobacterium sp. WLB]